MGEYRLAPARVLIDRSLPAAISRGSSSVWAKRCDPFTSVTQSLGCKCPFGDGELRRSRKMTHPICSAAHIAWYAESRNMRSPAGWDSVPVNRLSALVKEPGDRRSA